MSWQKKQSFFNFSRDHKQEENTKEEKCLDPYYNPEAPRFSRNNKNQSNNVGRIVFNQKQPGQGAMMNGLSARQKARAYYKKCEESKKWPQEAKEKKVPGFLIDKERDTPFARAEAKMQEIKKESKVEVKDMISESRQMLNRAQTLLNQASKGQTQKKEEAPKNIKQFRPQARIEFSRKPKPEAKVELLPCSFCSVEMSLSDMTEHHINCPMAFHCNKCQDFFPVYLAEDHISICKKSSKKKQTKPVGNQNKKYKEEKYFKPNQYQIEEYAEVMRGRFPELDQEQIMNLIYDDIDDQIAEAKRKGIPIEDSKYVPAEQQENDDFDEYNNRPSYISNMSSEYYSQQGDYYDQQDEYYDNSFPVFKEEKKQGGLTKKEISRLVTDKYKRGNQTEVQCAICSKEKEEGDDIIRLPCFHTYHSDCLLPWLEMKSVCPTCKHNLKQK